MALAQAAEFEARRPAIIHKFVAFGLVVGIEDVFKRGDGFGLGHFGAGGSAEFGDPGLVGKAMLELFGDHVGVVFGEFEAVPAGDMEGVEVGVQKAVEELEAFLGIEMRGEGIEGFVLGLLD